MDTSQLIIDTAEKIFSDHCDKGLLDATNKGHFPALWQQIVTTGFTNWAPNSGTETRDLFAFRKYAAVMRYHAQRKFCCRSMAGWQRAGPSSPYRTQTEKIVQTAGASG